MNTSNKKTGLFCTGGIFLFVLLVAIWSGCNSESKGFALPAGDAEAGKVAFEELNCNACHSIGDIEWAGEGEDLKLPLGGRTTRVRTYGELVTSVINPSHKISQSFAGKLVDSTGHSKMKVYNDIMTVQELVDIVTFLQSQYDVVVPEEQLYYPAYY